MSADRADFGSRLRAAREARGVSLRDIAAATKISVLVLEALERNDASRLPGGIFSRAFVRSYAKEVGLDLKASPPDSQDALIDWAEKLTQRDASGNITRSGFLITGSGLQPTTHLCF